jgi:hypothetical protein
MAEEPIKIPRRMQPRNFLLDVSGYVNNQWAARLEEGDTVEEALTSDFWSHIDKVKVRPQDQITLYTHDGQRRVALFVRAVSKTYLKVGVLSDVDFNPKVAAAADETLVPKWNVGKRKYEVVSTATKQVIQSDFPLKEDALAWIAQHKKAMAA